MSKDKSSKSVISIYIRDNKWYWMARSSSFKTIEGAYSSGVDFCKYLGSVININELTIYKRKDKWYWMIKSCSFHSMEDVILDLTRAFNPSIL